MGVATGCGFKEIYRFPHTTYPYSSCICTFLQQHPYFFVHFKNVFDIYIVIYIYIYAIESVDSISRDERRCSIDAIHYKRLNSSR